MHRHHHHHASSVGHQVKNRRGQLSLFPHRSKELRGSEIQSTQISRTLRHAVNTFWLKKKAKEWLGVTYEHTSLFVAFSICNSIYPPSLLLTREKVKKVTRYACLVNVSVYVYCEWDPFLSFFDPLQPGGTSEFGMARLSPKGQPFLWIIFQYWTRGWMVGNIFHVFFSF